MNNINLEDAKSFEVAKDYYNSIARDFESIDDFYDNPYDKATWNMENLLISSYLNNYKYIADIGAGFYPHIESLKETKVVNIDISAESLIVARNEYHEFNNKMEYICGNAVQLPFSNETFDGVVAGGELINHLDANKLIYEIYRVLKPGGRAILSVAMKWCFDSLYACFDSILGNRIGYSMKRKECYNFFKNPLQSSNVTWEVTPNFNLKVTLYTKKEIMRIIKIYNLKILNVRSLNIVSGIIPLPFQQSEDKKKFLHSITNILLNMDHYVFGRTPLLKWFAGNIYIVMEKYRWTQLK